MQGIRGPCRSTARLWAAQACALILGGLAAVSALDAAELTALPALSAAPVIDGHADDPAWVEAATFNLGFEIGPLHGKRIEPTATARIGTTATGLHILAVVEQSVPINASAAKHDSASGDNVTVHVQPDLDALRDYTFMINAVGATRDSINSSGGAGSYEWSGAWQSATTLTATGYIVEITIPWSTLEIAATENHVMGVSVERLLTSGRFDRHAISPLDVRKNCRECQYQHFTVAEIAAATDQSESRTRWLPYAIATAQRSYDPATGAVIESGNTVDAGLDALFKLRSGGKILLALNPDFSQVESDGFVSNINRRFAASFGERRPFFTEESGAFATPMALLYTRAISDPSVGIQYVQRDAGATRAILLADDSVTSYFDVGPTGSSQVVLPERSWNGGYRWTGPIERGEPSTWGQFASIRRADGYANVVVATDVDWKPGDHHEVIAQLAISHSQAEAPGEDLQSATDAALDASHYYSRGRYSSYTGYTDTGPDFRADLGILPTTGTRSIAHGSNYNWEMPADSTLSTASVSAYANATDDRDGLLLDSAASIGGALNFANEISLYSSLASQTSRDDETLIRTRGASVSASAKPLAHLGLSAAFDLGTSPDYVNATGGRYRSLSYFVYLTGVERIEADVSWGQSQFDSDHDGAGYEYSYWSASIKVHPRPRHHLTLFLNRFNSEDRLDLAVPATEADVRFQWQLTYTFEASRFSRLIVGASRSEIDGAGIKGLSPQRELAFAKWVLEL